MDRLAAGYPMPDTLAKMIADTVFAIIIVPTNSSPFSMTSWYHPRGRLFTDKLIDAFHTHYRRIEDGPLFRAC